MGFWSCGYADSQNKRAQEALDCVNFMTKEEVSALLTYIKNSCMCESYMGFADCRVCGLRLGTMDMETADKKWIFPEKWEHYITEHGVRPAEEFVQDALTWTQNFNARNNT